jgi:hypothetical protein
LGAFVLGLFGLLLSLRGLFLLVGFLLPFFVEHLIDQAVFLRLLGAHIPVPLGLELNLLDRLTGMLGQDTVDRLFGPEDLLGLDLDIGGLSGHAAPRLVQHDLGVGQGEPAALGTRRQNDGPAGLCPADAVRRNR